MSELRLFDPFALEPLDETFRSMLRPWKTGALEGAPRIKLDVSEKDGSYSVQAEIPGVRMEDIDVQVEGNLVTISAEVKSEKEEKEGSRVLRRERQQGYASRSFTLACPVDDAKVEAKYENGVLALTLPKKGGGATKRIAVK